MKLRRLAPALSVIESRLFDPSPSLVRRWLDGDPTLPAERREALAADPAAREIAEALQAPPLDLTDFPETFELEPLPGDLAAAIEAREAAAAAYPSTQPVPGLVVRIDDAVGPSGPLDWDLGSSLYALLSEPTDHPDIWHGWLVSDETDYASDFDLIFGEEDGPMDPDAVMVQLWNPVHVYCPAVAAAVGRLPADRLAAVRQAFADMLDGRAVDVPPDPGLWILRGTSRGQVIVTGTPLAEDDDDPRLRFQELYFSAAGFLRDLARHALAELAAEAPWWRSALDAIRRAAGELGLPWEPVPVPDLGPEDETSGEIEIWRLGDLLDLEMIPSADGDALGIRARLHGDAPLEVFLERGGLVRQLRRLTPEAPTGELTVASDVSLVLRVRDASGKELFSAPIAAAGDDGGGA